MTDICGQLLRLNNLLAPVLRDGRLVLPEITGALEWDPHIFERGDADPEFCPAECFVLVIGHSIITVPNIANDDADLQVFFADAVQDTVVDSIGRAWPSINTRVLSPRVNSDGVAVWIDKTARTRVRMGELTQDGVDS